MGTLTKQQLEYARQRASGSTSQVDAYMLAYPKAKRTSARTLAKRLEKKPEVQEEIARLRKETETPLVLSRQEKREFLARVVRVNPLEIDPDDKDDPNADLIEGVTRYYNKDGDHIRTVLKMPSKEQAVEIDNKMAGHNEPDEVNMNMGGGVMVVPIGGATLDDWEKEAVKVQAALKSLTAGGGDR